MTQAILERAARWCQPIRPDAFAGDAGRDDARFEQLNLEVAKLGSLHGEVCDWAAVLHCADALLRERTKDMSVLGALCVALLQREGLGGLMAGVCAYRQLAEEHLAELFPPPGRKRGRAGAFSWLTQRLTAALDPLPEAVAADHDALRQCAEDFERLDALVNGELGEMRAATGAIKGALAALVEQSAPAPAPPAPAPAPAPEAEPAPPPPPEAAPEPRLASEPALQAQPLSVPQPALPGRLLPERIEDADQAAALLELLHDGLALLGEYQLRQAPRRALGYQLALAASMLGVVPEGDRAAPSLSPRRLRELEQAAHEAAPAVVDELLLAVLADGGGLNPRAICLLAQALSALGTDHEAAAAEVAGHAAAAVLALGSLADLKPDEAAWLGARIAPILGLELATAPAASPAAEAAPPLTAAPPPGEGEAWLVAQVAAAREAAAGQGLAAGCHLLQESLDACGLKPDRFRVRLALAELCLAHQAADLGQPLLRGLLDELKQPALEWQPELLVAAATALLACNEQLVGRLGAEHADALRRESVELLALVARVDAEAACRLRPG
ncbi:MAG: type VI secretion system ImpA family N-terminal domain-containing protein [Proteobacteria bacterium]|nr:type VI secretion system ImpA family N-terminal domain-containing protein [Pseudomonadota bacterium]